MITDDEFWEKCQKGPITQKDLPSYDQMDSSAKNTAGNIFVEKDISAGIQYLHYELNSKTEKKDEESGE
ncbi:MAG: hypothetical protein LUF27_04530 [Lachnospiraceae bacterium]|nr:hypothetical protein [Lachnospiraceae bacterium]